MKEKFNTMFERAVDWILWSSADPEKHSMTIKAALTAYAAWILQQLSLACGLGLVCLNVDSNDINQLIEAIGALVSLVLYMVATVVGLYGLIRKIINTVLGTQYK